VFYLDIESGDAEQALAIIAELLRALTPGIAEFGHTRLDVECRAERTQRIVPMGDGRGEEGHDGIADMLVHITTVLGDDRIGAGIESFDQPAEVLGIKPGRERSEAAEIGEEDGHLPTLTGGIGLL